MSRAEAESRITGRAFAALTVRHLNDRELAGAQELVEWRNCEEYLYNRTNDWAILFQPFRLSAGCRDMMSDTNRKNESEPYGRTCSVTVNWPLPDESEMFTRQPLLASPLIAVQVSTVIVGLAGV